MFFLARYFFLLVLGISFLQGAESLSTPTGQPTGQPSRQPTRQPTGQPSAQPSRQPTGQPTVHPSSQPSGQPSAQPSGQPNMRPSGQPSRQPISRPSGQPSAQPTSKPSVQPISRPSGQPSRQPTGQPSTQPNMRPSGQPSGQPSRKPSVQPVSRPSGQPSRQPTGQPSTQPNMRPSGQPSGQPTSKPTSQPNVRPSGQPSKQPLSAPTRQPTSQPSSQPTMLPTTIAARPPIVIASSFYLQSISPAQLDANLKLALRSSLASALSINVGAVGPLTTTLAASASSTPRQLLRSAIVNITLVATNVTFSYTRYNSLRGGNNELPATAIIDIYISGLFPAILSTFKTTAVALEPSCANLINSVGATLAAPLSSTYSPTFPPSSPPTLSPATASVGTATTTIVNQSVSDTLITALIVIIALAAAAGLWAACRTRGDGGPAEAKGSSPQPPSLGRRLGLVSGVNVVAPPRLDSDPDNPSALSPPPLADIPWKIDVEAPAPSEVKTSPRGSVLSLPSSFRSLGNAEEDSKKGAAASAAAEKGGAVAVATYASETSGASKVVGAISPRDIKTSPTKALAARLFEISKSPQTKEKGKPNKYQKLEVSEADED